MIAVKYADLLSVLRVPDVDPAVAAARDDELRVWGEGSLERELLGVEMTGERLERGSVVGVDQLDHRPIGRDQDGLPIGREL